MARKLSSFLSHFRCSIVVFLYELAELRIRHMPMVDTILGLFRSVIQHIFKKAIKWLFIFSLG